MTEVNYKKLLEQEPEFKRFAEEVVLAAMVQNNQDFLGFVHSMYQVGSSADQVVQVLKNMMQPRKEKQ